MFDDIPSLVSVLLRFGHIMFGIIWLGHLYFFNLVNVPFQADLDKELKPKVNPKLLLRAFWWFRWGAMYTLLFGLALFFYKYAYQGLFFNPETGSVSVRAGWIMFGMLLGPDHVVQRLVRDLAAAEADPGRHGGRHPAPRRRQAGRDRRQGFALQHLRLRADAVRDDRPEQLLGLEPLAACCSR